MLQWIWSRFSFYDTYNVSKSHRTRGYKHAWKWCWRAMIMGPYYQHLKGKNSAPSAPYSQVARATYTIASPSKWARNKCTTQCAQLDFPVHQEDQNDNLLFVLSCRLFNNPLHWSMEIFVKSRLSMANSYHSFWCSLWAGLKYPTIF